MSETGVLWFVNHNRIGQRKRRLISAMAMVDNKNGLRITAMLGWSTLFISQSNHAIWPVCLSVTTAACAVQFSPKLQIHRFWLSFSLFKMSGIRMHSCPGRCDYPSWPFQPVSILPSRRPLRFQRFGPGGTRPRIVNASLASTLPNDGSSTAKHASRIRVGPPQGLPPPPLSSNLLDVLPYLAELALSDKTLYWRLALSLSLLSISKVAGSRCNRRDERL
jgi:hypothetical protein